jgi:hypothetical protein
MASLLREGRPEGVIFRRAYRIILTRVDADAIRAVNIKVARIGEHSWERKTLVLLRN